MSKYKRHQQEEYTGGDLLRGIMVLGGVSHPIGAKCMWKFAPEPDCIHGRIKIWSVKALLAYKPPSDEPSIWPLVIKWLRKDREVRGKPSARRYYRFLEGNISIE